MYDAITFKDYATGTLLVLDLIGTFVFALSGAVVGVKRRLDIFGVVVISFAAASAGGIMRDLLIDSVPPAAIRGWRYMAAWTDGWAATAKPFSARVRYSASPLIGIFRRSISMLSVQFG